MFAEDQHSPRAPDPGNSGERPPRSDPPLDNGQSSADFIFEPIAVHFEHPPELEKKPSCPNAFTWRERLFRITALESEWRDYRRRGRMAHNMRPEHAATARRRGSWGVGRQYFQVRLDSGASAVLCYDRSPRSVHDRKGSWRLLSIDSNESSTSTE